MKDEKLIYLEFNDVVPNIGSVMIGDADIHSTLTDFRDVGMFYSGVMSRLSNTESVVNDFPLLSLLERLTRTRTHTNLFWKETFNFDTRALFQSGSTYSDPTPVKTKSVSWEIWVEYFESKILNMNQIEVKTLVRSGRSVIPEFIRAMDIVINTYVREILPALYYRPLFNVPDVGGEYQEKFGLLRNVVVDSTLLSNYDESASAGSRLSTTRNHYRAIKTPTGLGGGINLTPEDIGDAKDYLMQYTSNEGMEIVAFTTARVITKLSTNVNVLASKDKMFHEGIETIKVNGIHFVDAGNVIPEDFIFFAVVDTNKEIGALLTKVISPLPEFQGLYLAHETGEFAWDNITNYNCENVKLVVGDIQIALTGRFKGLWLDCGNRASTNGIMSNDGINILKKKYANFQSKLYY